MVTFLPVPLGKFSVVGRPFSNGNFLLDVFACREKILQATRGLCLNPVSSRCASEVHRPSLSLAKHKAAGCP